MQIILSKNCQSFTGSLGQGYGYSITRRNGRFFSVRSPRGAPPDGHLAFIFACAWLAQNGLHITDICVPVRELSEAVFEATRQRLNRIYPLIRYESTLNAKQVLTLKRELGL